MTAYFTKIRNWFTQDKKNVANVAEKLMALLFVIELAVTVIAIFTCKINEGDGDAANLYTHAVEIWRNRTLYIPGWRHSSIGEFDTPLFIASLLYTFSKNIFFNIRIANFLYLFAFLWTVQRICEKRLTALLTLNLILVPYSVGMLEYYNMLFNYAAFYSYKALVPLMAVAVCVRFDPKKLSDKLFMALFSVMLLLTSMSSGLFAFGCGVMWVLVGYFLRFFIRNELPDRRRK